MDKITTPMLLKALETVEARGAIETAHRTQSICSRIFDYAIRTGLLDRNPASSLGGALRATPERHFAAITEPKEFGGLLRAIDAYKGGIIVRSALRLAPLVFVRPGEMRKAEWVEIDWDESVWNIPGPRMKMKEAHIVPLSRQALSILREIQPFTGSSPYIFPTPRNYSRPMSDGAVLAALRSMGYEQGVMTGHGFRATARTILDEVLEVPLEYIEHQLAHRVRDPLDGSHA